MINVEKVKLENELTEMNKFKNKKNELKNKFNSFTKQSDNPNKNRIPSFYKEHKKIFPWISHQEGRQSMQSPKNTEYMNNRKENIKPHSRRMNTEFELNFLKKPLHQPMKSQFDGNLKEFKIPLKS